MCKENKQTELSLEIGIIKTKPVTSVDHRKNGENQRLLKGPPSGMHQRATAEPKDICPSYTLRL